MWRWVVRVLAVIGALALVGAFVGAIVLAVKINNQERDSGQKAPQLDAFYAKPTTLPVGAVPGTIIRSEPLEYAVAGGKGFRIVYSGIGLQGEQVPISGMIFIPDAPAPSGGRKVLAFAHGTVGTAAECAPSRATTAAAMGFTPWLLPALQQGWVVVLTDYLGLGIEGPSTYLIGEQEARDVVNSVRAARAFPGSEAGADWIVFGSSQGGNSALWTADLAPEMAPDLPLKAVMAAVPAAELGSTVSAQWDKLAVWALGPAVLSSWVRYYPDRDFLSIVTKVAQDQLPKLNDKCIVGDALTGVVDESLGRKFFSSNPLDSPAWAQTLREQTPPPPPSAMPMLLLQGTADDVVLSGSNATLQEQWCAAGRPMTSLWLGGVSHQNTQLAGGPAAIEWAARRFDGQAPTDTCSFGVPAPVVALPNPVPRT